MIRERVRLGERIYILMHSFDHDCRHYHYNEKGVKEESLASIHPRPLHTQLLEIIHPVATRETSVQDDPPHLSLVSAVEEKSIRYLFFICNCSSRLYTCTMQPDEAVEAAMQSDHVSSFVRSDACTKYAMPMSFRYTLASITAGG